MSAAQTHRPIRSRPSYFALCGLALALPGVGCAGRDPRIPAQVPRPAVAVVAGPTLNSDVVAPAGGAGCAALKRLAESAPAALSALGLSPAAMEKVAAFRSGEDGKPGTLDDRYFESDEDIGGLRLGASELAALSGAACGKVPLQLLAFNDFHGALEPPSGRAGQIETADGPVDAGGAEYFATWLKQLRGDEPNTLVVAAGDNIGATPLVSAAFHDEPTIEALNLFGLALSSVGNHEFDEGLTELIRMQQGGCHPEKGCFGDTPFEGARFGYLAANVVVEATGETAFPPFAIRRFGKVPVAFIGMTLEGTPEVVTPAGTAGLSFKDEVDTVNKLVPRLDALGVKAIVVLVHEGGFATGNYNGCEGISGPIFDIVKALDRQVDVVISGHTNAAHVCNVDGILVTSAAHNGRLVTDIDLVLDESTQDVASSSARNVIVGRDVEKDPRLTELLGTYQALVRNVSRRVVGTIAEDLVRKSSESGEMPLGGVIADAQLFAEADPSAGSAEIAWINPGGVRADIVRTRPGGETPAEGEPKAGEVTFGDLFTVQPFGNALVTMTLTGKQVEAVLEAQFTLDGKPRNNPKMLQISYTLSYAINPDGPVGDKIDPATIEVDGQVLDPARKYRVTMNEFLATGGDGFEVLKEGTERRIGIVDVDALEYYLSKYPNLTAPAPGRVRLQR